jgi:hypothetical protein
MMAYASDPISDFDDLVGFSLELRTEYNKVLYRQIMRDPFQSTIEVFNPPGSNETIYMVPRSEIAGHFVLLVPDLPDAHHVALVRSGPDRAGQKLEKIDVAYIPVLKGRM